MMSEKEIIETLLSAVVKIQSAIHDLEFLPEQSTFRQLAKQQCNLMIEFNKNYIKRLAPAVEEITKDFNLTQSQEYIALCSKLDKIRDEINYIYTDVSN
jgi:hypothetical protein